MFAKTIIDSDMFLDMPLSTQALYFHLSMRADDDGFINNPKKIQRMIGASDDDLRVLVMKRFILPFDSGVVVIKHWKIHNYIRNDRYKETVYQEEKAQLDVKENGAYTELSPLGIPDDNQLGDELETQVRLGKDRLVQVSVGKESIEDEASPSTRSKRFTPPTVDEVRAYCLERGNCVNPQRFVDYYSSNGWMVGKNKMKDWKAAVRTWEQKESNSRPAAAKSSNPFLDMLEDGDYE
jgi:hypothetical protein